MPFQTISGISYYFEQFGTGPPLLLLHGFTGSSKNWETLLPRLTEQFQVILVDLMGHGKTDAPEAPDRYGIEQAAADLHTLLDKLGIEKTDLLGYSMGGRLALSFALTYPEKVNHLILESASPGLARSTEQTERIDRDNNLANRIEREGINHFVTFWEGLSLWESQQKLSPLTRSHLRQRRLQNRELGLANSLRGMGTGRQPSYWGLLTQLEPKTLLLSGEEDGKFCKIAREMCPQISDCTHITVANAGHTIHLEAPERYAEIVIDYLTRA